MFRNRKWIGTVLVTLLVLVLLAAGGKAIYRLGYNHGMSKALPGVTPGAMRFGMHGFGMKEMEPGREGLRSQHPFKYQGGSQGPKSMFPRHGGHGIHNENMSSVRGNNTHGRYGGHAVFRLLFAAALVGLFVYVVVKIFQPGGWQLSFGPLHNTNPDDAETNNPGAKSSKAKKASAKKGK